MTALRLNDASLCLALLGVLGRPRRLAVFAIDGRGHLVAARADDSFAPTPGEALDRFIARVFAQAVLAEGDVIEATVSNGALVGVTVQHQAGDVPPVALDLSRCKEAWRALVVTLASGYGRLAFRVVGDVLAMDRHDLTLRLDRGETLVAFIDRMARVGVWMVGDAVELTSDGQGRLNTVRITRR